MASVTMEEWYAEKLRKMCHDHIQQIDDHWKGRVFAVVPNEDADMMREAMGFIGSIVDWEKPGAKEGTTFLYSDGYWAHGF